MSSTDLTEVDSQILNRFRISNDAIGKGAYGIVFRAQDKHSGEVVALKKCFDAFRNGTDAQRTYREVCYLQKLKGHPNIVELSHLFLSKSGRDLYLTFDLMDTDLHRIIKQGTVLQDVHKQYITYQLLKALKWVHSAKLLHRDIKPSNILVNADCTIKLCDFGLARSLSDDNEAGEARRLTDYVATRWYRAPEILLGSTNYSKGIDLWAAGCITGEMIRGRPLFAGSSTMNQLELVLEYSEEPSTDDIASIRSPFCDTMLSSLPAKKERKHMSELCQGATAEALDFVMCCLRFNPTKRLSAAELLRHPYVSSFHDRHHEPNYPRGAIASELAESVTLSPVEYKNLLEKCIEEERLAALRRHRDKLRERGSLASVTAPPPLVDEQKY